MRWTKWIAFAAALGLTLASVSDLAASDVRGVLVGVCRGVCRDVIGLDGGDRADYLEIGGRVVEINGEGITL